MMRSIHTRLNAVILLVSLGLRWLLVFQGGQYFFSDEERYEVSRKVALLILKNNLKEALAQLFTAPEHLGFKVIGVIPALLEHFIHASLVVPALFFSLFSVFNLFLNTRFQAAAARLKERRNMR